MVLILGSTILHPPDLPPPLTTFTPPPAAAFDPTASSAPPAYRLALERADGTRLTLCVPAADGWARVEALCSSFLRS